MKFNLKKGEKEVKVCMFCGKRGMNPYGECVCSYESEAFQSQKVRKIVRMIIKFSTLMK